MTRKQGQGSGINEQQGQQRGRTDQQDSSAEPLDNMQ
jgi:hypothetical protein